MPEQHVYAHHFPEGAGKPALLMIRLKEPCVTMLRKIRGNEFKKAAQILAEGFRNYPLYDTLFSDPGRKMKCMYDFYLNGIYIRRNFIYVTDDLSLIVCIKKTGDKLTGNPYFSHPLLLLDLLFHIRRNEFKRIHEFLILCSEMEAKHRKPGDWNIEFICKNRDSKNTPDLQAIFEELHLDTSLYCETHSPAHVRLYKRYGFAVVDRVDFYGLTHYVLRRDAAETVNTSGNR